MVIVFSAVSRISRASAVTFVIPNALQTHIPTCALMIQLRLKNAPSTMAPLKPTVSSLLII